MRVAVSAAGKEKNSVLDMRFGRCSYFQVYEMENEEMKAIENKGQSSSGGAGIAAAEQIIDEKVDVVITGNVGPNAHKLLDGSNIKIYKCDSIEITNVIEKYKKGELVELSQVGPAHNGGGR